MIETVKPAEDGDGIVVRFYEAHNTRGPATLTFPAEMASVEETNMLEEPIGVLQSHGKSVPIVVRPYGITTLRVRLHRD